MNTERRKRIQALVLTLNDLRGQVNDLASEEQEAFDNMPEGLQQSERGQETERAAEALGNGDGLMNEVISELEGLL